MFIISLGREGERESHVSPSCSQRWRRSHTERPQSKLLSRDRGISISHSMYTRETLDCQSLKQLRTDNFLTNTDEFLITLLGRWSVSSSFPFICPLPCSDEGLPLSHPVTKENSDPFSHILSVALIQLLERTSGLELNCPWLGRPHLWLGAVVCHWAFTLSVVSFLQQVEHLHGSMWVSICWPMMICQGARTLIMCSTLLDIMKFPRLHGDSSSGSRSILRSPVDWRTLRGSVYCRVLEGGSSIQRGLWWGLLRTGPYVSCGQGWWWDTECALPCHHRHHCFLRQHFHDGNTDIDLQNPDEKHHKAGLGPKVMFSFLIQNLDFPSRRSVWLWLPESVDNRGSWMPLRVWQCVAVAKRMLWDMACHEIRGQVLGHCLIIFTISVFLTPSLLPGGHRESLQTLTVCLHSS